MAERQSGIRCTAAPPRAARAKPLRPHRWEQTRSRGRRDRRVGFASSGQRKRQQEDDEHPDDAAGAERSRFFPTTLRVERCEALMFGKTCGLDLPARAWPLFRHLP